MTLTLRREQLLPECTLGMLEVGGKSFFTIERPWVPRDGCAGGSEFVSCVPEGQYRLLAHKRPSGEKAFALVNSALGIYHMPHEVPRGSKARALVLIHAADYVHEVYGGIGPGLQRKRDQFGWIVTSSLDAMNQIRTLVANRIELTLIIERTTKDAV